MSEITFEYWNKLAEITITISSLLAGFSIAIIANLLVSELNSKLLKSIMTASILAACFFLITVFAMTSLLMMTTNGYPFEVKQSDLDFPRISGVLAFLSGIVSLITIIALAGWTKSKKMGKFTTALGVVTFKIILFFMT